MVSLYILGALTPRDTRAYGNPALNPVPLPLETQAAAGAPANTVPNEGATPALSAEGPAPSTEGQAIILGAPVAVLPPAADASGKASGLFEAAMRSPLVINPVTSEAIAVIKPDLQTPEFLAADPNAAPAPAVEPLGFYPTVFATAESDPVAKPFAAAGEPYPSIAASPLGGMPFMPVSTDTAAASGAGGFLPDLALLPAQPRATAESDSAAAPTANAFDALPFMPAVASPAASPVASQAGFMPDLDMLPAQPQAAVQSSFATQADTAMGASSTNPFDALPFMPTAASPAASQAGLLPDLALLLPQPQAAAQASTRDAASGEQSVNSPDAMQLAVLSLIQQGTQGMSATAPAPSAEGVASSGLPAAGFSPATTPDLILPLLKSAHAGSAADVEAGGVGGFQPLEATPVAESAAGNILAVGAEAPLPRGAEIAGFDILPGAAATPLSGADAQTLDVDTAMMLDLTSDLALDLADSPAPAPAVHAAKFPRRPVDPENPIARAAKRAQAVEEGKIAISAGHRKVATAPTSEALLSAAIATTEGATPVSSSVHLVEPLAAMAEAGKGQCSN